MSFDLFPSFVEFYFLIYRPIIYYSSFYLVYVSSINSSRYFGLSFVLFLDLSIYLSIYLLIIGLLMYLLVHLFYVLSLSTRNSFCKPFQISQIEYSDGASTILNLSGSKKEYVFVFFHLSMYLCCPLLAFVYLSIFWSTYFLYSFIFGIFF